MAAPTFQIHLRQCFLGELLHLSTTLLVVVALVAAALGNDPVNQVSGLSVMDGDLGAVLIRDGEHRAAVVEPIDAEAQHPLRIHANGISRHRRVAAVAVHGEGSGNAA